MPRIAALSGECRCAGLLDGMAALKPVVAHSIGLSIGTAARFDQGHVAQIAEWRRRYAMPWHLSSMHAQHHKGMEVNGGLMMPVPCDQASLEMLTGRSTGRTCESRPGAEQQARSLTRIGNCLFPGVHPRGENFGIFQPHQHPLRHLFFLAASFRCAARRDRQEFRAILGGNHLAAAVARPLAFATGKRIAVDTEHIEQRLF